MSASTMLRFRRWTAAMFVATEPRSSPSSAARAASEATFAL
jgi:hypothetical protein